ncbi:hypothetical protein KQI52_10955 [bacterium]|nr:hypothetical protein [bacterium]
MKRGWRIVLNVITLTAFISSAVLVVFALFLQQVAIENQINTPSEASFQLMLKDLKQEISWRLFTVEPDEPTNDNLRRYPFRWSRDAPWQNPANPALADSANHLLDLFAGIQPDSVSFQWPASFGLMRNEDGTTNYVLTFQFYDMAGDTIASGVITPRRALYDHYLPAWFDKYTQYSTYGRVLPIWTESFPLQLVVKPTNSTEDTLLLAEGIDILYYQGKALSEADQQALMMEVNELVPGLGWLTLRGPGLGDKAVVKGTKRLMFVIVGLWVVTLAGLLWIITLNERARQLGYAAEQGGSTST